MQRSERFKHNSFKVALAMDWGKRMWVAFAVAFISLATAGQSVNKGMMRLVGTLLGAHRGISEALIDFSN
jgi:uncharacterized membrane protein YccC